VVTVDRDTVHTSGVSEVNDTDSPEVADADKVTGTPTGASGGSTNAVIVCDRFPTTAAVTRARCTGVGLVLW